MSKTYIAAIGITGLVLIVFVAIGADMLLPLILGSIMLGLVSIGLSWIGARVFALFTKSTNERDSERHRHAEEMARRGLMPVGRGFPKYDPLPAAPCIDAPAPAKQISPPANQIQFTATDPQILAVNLLKFTINLGRADKNLIASAPECAAGGIIGYSPRKRDYAVVYLKDNYKVVATAGNGGGTYVPAEIGTVEKLYHMVMQRSAIEALPGRDSDPPAA